MKLPHIVSIAFSIIAFTVTELAVAYCPVPLTSDSMCCYYAGPNGTTDNRFARSLDGCLADAKATNSLLINSQNPMCFSFGGNPFGDPNLPTNDPVPATIIQVQENISTPIAPTVPGGEWRQNFRHVYVARAVYSWLNPPYVVTYNCADYSGHLNWVVPPPPPTPVACSILDMPAIPTADTCTNSLEANNGLPGATSGCPEAPVMTRVLGERCFSGKLNTLGITYNGPTSTIRTNTYNQHLRTVWDYHLKHRFISDPLEFQACAPKRAIVMAEMRKHGIVHEPAVKSRHLAGRAFDASQTVIAGIGKHKISAMLRRATACTLIWGGSWRDQKSDPVHFELNVP